MVNIFQYISQKCINLFFLTALNKSSLIVSNRYHGLLFLKQKGLPFPSGDLLVLVPSHMFLSAPLGLSTYLPKV